MTQNDQPVRPALRLLLRTPIFLRPVNVSLSGESRFTDGNCFAAGGGTTHPALMVQTKCVVPPVTTARQFSDGHDVFHAVVFEYLGHPCPPVTSNPITAQNDNPMQKGNEIASTWYRGTKSISPGRAIRPVKVGLHNEQQAIGLSKRQKHIARVTRRTNEITTEVIELRKSAVRIPFGSTVSACPHSDLLTNDVLARDFDSGVSRRRDRTQLIHKNLLIDMALGLLARSSNSGLLRRMRRVRDVAHRTIVELIHPFPAVMDLAGFRAVLLALMFEKSHSTPDSNISTSIVALNLESDNARGVQRNLCLFYIEFSKDSYLLQRFIKVIVKAAQPDTTESGK